MYTGTSRQVKTTQFLCAVVELLLDYISKSNDRTGKVLDFHHPQTLKDMMAHCLDIPDEPQNLEQILSDCKETLKYCVKTGSTTRTGGSAITDLYTGGGASRNFSPIGRSKAYHTLQYFSPRPRP